MTYQIVVDNEWCTIRYNPDDEYIYHTFHQPIGGEIFRTVMSQGLDALIENGAQKWLSDDRKNGLLAPEDVAWSVTEWGPRAAQGGWKYWALVVPETIAGRIGMTDIVDTFYQMGVRVSIFTDLEEAREWLLKL